MKTKHLACLLTTLAVSAAVHGQPQPVADSVRTLGGQEVMALHQGEIVLQGEMNGEDAFAELCLKYYVPSKDIKALQEVTRRRETQKAACRYTHPVSSFARAKARMAIDSLYRDSVNAILLPHNKGISGENISYAVKMAQALDYDKTTQDYLMDQALRFARQLYANPKKNVWNDEMTILRGAFSEDQLKLFFHLKNAAVVTRQTNDAWSKLKAAGLSEELDSVSDCARTYVYYQDRQMIMDLYKYQPNNRRKHLAELERLTPQMVKLLDGLNKRRRAEKEPEKNVGKEFVW